MESFRVLKLKTTKGRTRIPRTKLSHSLPRCALWSKSRCQNCVWSLPYPKNLLEARSLWDEKGSKFSGALKNHSSGHPG